MLVFPPTPNVGDQANGMIWDGAKWTCAGEAGGGANVFVGQPAPATARTGDLWWDVRDGALSVFTGSEWVSTTCGSGGGGAAFEPDTTGTGDTFVLQDQPTINQPLVNQPRVMGVTDGSNAGPGEVGEYLSWQSTSPATPTPNGAASQIGPLVLSAGDWDVGGWASVNFRVTATGSGGMPAEAGFNAQLSVAPQVFWQDMGLNAHNSIVTPNQFFGIRGALPICRVNVASQLNVNVLANVFTGGVGFTITVSSTEAVAFIWARRVR